MSEKQQINRIRISENFSLHEFECKDGSHQVCLHPRLLQRLQQMRTDLNRPVVVISGYRNPAHNARVGGSPTSRHLTGMAADIRVPGLSIDQLAARAEAAGFTGIGKYTSFLHVDVRPTPARWDQR